jgi:hypothetical protein
MTASPSVNNANQWDGVKVAERGYIYVLGTYGGAQVVHLLDPLAEQAWLASGLWVLLPGP